VTSDKCYENREWIWGYRENEAMGGFDPYSSSKGCAELITSAYQRSYFTGHSKANVSSVRSGNVIGGGDWSADRLIPDLCYAFSRGKAAKICNPNSIRPWQHVLEPLSAYLLLAEKSSNSPGQYIGGWNFGADFQDAKPVSWIADKLIELWGGKAQWFTDNNEHLHEAQILRLDCSKAKSLLNWTPRLNLTQSLKLTVKWYQAFEKNEDMENFTRQQIQSFINMETV
jgi:CDP-glucose 4,6-dehydratase